MDSRPESAIQLRAEHKLETGRLQRSVDQVTAWIGWPGAIVVVLLMMSGWIFFNLLGLGLGFSVVDPPPFVWLQGTAAAGALMVSTLILTTQRREDQLAGHRSQMILELAIMNDQKLSKVIELLEEVRRDNPAIHNRVDDQAVAMSTPADTRAVLDAIKEEDS